MTALCIRTQLGLSDAQRVGHNISDIRSKKRYSQMQRLYRFFFLTYQASSEADIVPCGYCEYPLDAYMLLKCF